MAVQVKHPSKKYVLIYIIGIDMRKIWGTDKTLHVVCIHQIAGIRRCSSKKYGEPYIIYVFSVEILQSPKTIKK
jgi:hypothetical protein